MAEPYASYRMLARRAWLILRARVWQLRRWWRRYRAEVLPARLPTILHYGGIASSRSSQEQGKRLATQMLKQSVGPVRKAVQYKADIAGLLYDTPAIPADLVALGQCSQCARHVREAQIQTVRTPTTYGTLVYAFADCPNGHRGVRKIGVYAPEHARRERPDEWLRRMLGPFPTRTGYQGPPPLLPEQKMAGYGDQIRFLGESDSVRPVWDSSGDGRAGS